MLNKEEKRIFMDYIKPIFKQIDHISFNYDSMEEFKEEIENYNFLTNEIEKSIEINSYLVISKIGKLTRQIERLFETIINGNYVKKMSFEQNYNRKEKDQLKLKKMIDKSKKIGIIQGKLDIIDKSKIVIEDQKNKSELIGIKKANKINKLSDDQILNLAKKIRLERKLGFKK